ncbi:MAG TPA: DMT family transporter [Opitutaceae bacterium]|nr:DMT family transporter [Opitutaceae bacterium]HRJ47548.1 DMT family transporter [Opitutaceae bacterium]
MTPLALILVLTAAVLHATWNLCAKRAASGLPFVWASGVASLVLWTPLAVGYWWLHPQAITMTGLWFIILSGVLHCGYSLFLQRAYRAGDFSLVYPLARGTGPLLSSLAAITVLGERPSALAGSGGGLIIMAIFFLTGGHQLLRGKAGAGSGAAVFYGVGCGAFIAAYTVADRQAVTYALVPPLLLDWGGNVARMAIFAPFAVRRWTEVKQVWQNYRLECLAVAVLGPLAYILVLWAMTFTPLTYIAPLREVSILFGTFIGAKLLKETDGPRRLWAAGVMAIGVVALALG